MPGRVKLAILVAFILHGILILAARYRLSYDAYTHMLIADQYRLDWWSLWDPRWYTGFDLTSYPPLVHQLIALFGRLVGVDAGYGLVSWIVLTISPAAVYAFSRVFVDQAAAEFASLGAAVLPSLYLSAYTFGQLPTLASLVFALLCSAALADFLRTGRRISGGLAAGLAALVAASHHATLLLLPVLVAALVGQLLLNRQVDWKTLCKRMAVFAPLALLAGLLVVWPFWQWGIGQALQVPIPHPTRDNYLTDFKTLLLFFICMYGPLLFFIPFVLRSGLGRRYFSLSAAFSGLFILGLGGTTPLPRLLFGASWEWLTYDRFALWASVCLLPFFGLAAASGWRNRYRVLGLGSLAVTSLAVSLIPTFLPTQPPPVEMQPILDFLAGSDRSQWRYLTFGFGDQFALLNRLTSATTIDGSYHTARSLPELRSSGLGQIDTAYWLPGGMAALGPILQKAGQYGVRWGFVDLLAYDPLLQQAGWVYRSTLSNSIQVWENPAAALPAPSLPPVVPPITAFSWGTLPFLALTVTGLLAGLRFRPLPARQFLFGLQSILVGLLPFGLALWYFYPLTHFEAPRVYFTYTDSLFFASDALAFGVVLCWLLGRTWSLPLFGGMAKLVEGTGFWLFSLCSLATLSALWSQAPQVSLTVGLHLWLAFGLFLALRERPELWRPAAAGLCAALALEIIIGLGQFFAQSTAFLAPLHLLWPGPLTPDQSGASVVQLADGTRWLRVYGTLAHPNLLGILSVAFLAGPLAFFLSSRQPRPGLILLFAGGLILLILTFSRAAWIGALGGALLALVKIRNFNGKRLLALGSAGAVSLAAAVIPLRALVFTRVADPAAALPEQISIIGRTWLADMALNMIPQHPILGGGAGTFILELSKLAPAGYLVEPVHNLPLLVASDLGFFGVITVLGLGWAIVRGLFKSRRPLAIVFGAAVLGLALTSLFDHALWTLAPGQMLFTLLLGLWAGQLQRFNLPFPEGKATGGSGLE